MKQIINIIILHMFSFCVASSLEGMWINSLKHSLRINPDKSQDLAIYAKKFLEKHADKVIYQENESGFVRINIPIMEESIEKIRLNYWPAHRFDVIGPETVHSHPRYFESIIIQGGYRHQLYSKRITNEYISYDQYRLLKDLQNKKKFMFLGKSKLALQNIESTQKNSIIGFPTRMIHRVLSTEPSTLSLNVVFKDSSPEPYYDVYVSPDGNTGDVKLTRKYLLLDETELLTAEIISALQAFIVPEENKS
jgi:hypothetical protein